MTSKFIKSNLIFIEEPPVTSMAAYVLLVKSYFKSQVPEWVNWLRVRDAWITKQKIIHGTLSCVACGKKELKDHGNNDNSATIDHIIPISAGGSKYDERNFQILCRKCNSTKGSKLYEQFLKTLNK